MRFAHGASATATAALDRPRLWRVTTALAALLLLGLVALCAQGSLTIIARRPVFGRRGVAAAPRWERWCTRGKPRQDRRRLAFCARVDGRVLASTVGPLPGERHLALISDFQIVIVRLPEYAPRPARGTQVVAIGPLFRARDGQREVQAFRIEPA
jgi:hypothetical protein